MILGDPDCQSVVANKTICQPQKSPPTELEGVKRQETVWNQSSNKLLVQMENEAGSHTALPGHFPDFPVFYKVPVCCEWEVSFALFESKEK